jgi:hypothetical protein
MNVKITRKVGLLNLGAILDNFVQQLEHKKLPHSFEVSKL